MSAVHRPKPRVSLQLAPHNFYDEGIEHVLDTLQRLAGVEELFVYSQVLHDAWGQKDPAAYPDHGAPRPPGPRPNIARVWHRTHPEYYRGLPMALEQDADRVYGGRDIFDDLRGPAAARGIKIGAFILEPGWNIPLPGWNRVAAVDTQGRRRGAPCPRNPDFRAWWNAGIEDLLTHHPFLSGVLFGQERGTSLSGMLNQERPADDYPICFCEHCLAEAHRRGIHAERARAGMQALHDTAAAWRAGAESPPDGAFTVMLRYFLEYPEILAWDRMFMDAMESQRREIYGIIHAAGNSARAGWHIETNNSFDPFRRAHNDLSRYRAFSDFVKLVVYSNANGFRARYWFWHTGTLKTWLRDVPDTVAIPFLYHIMGYDPAREPGADALRDGANCPGFSSDYVYRETLRGVKMLGGVPLYAGVGVDIPPGPPQGAATTLESAYNDTLAALGAGAAGILISRDYTEMQLAGIEGVGRAVRDWVAGK